MIFKFALLFVFLSFVPKGFASHHQFWNENIIEKQLDSHWKVLLQADFRWQEGFFFWKFFQLHFQYQYTPNFLIAPSYRLNFFRNKHSSWKKSSEAMVDITNILPTSSFIFSNRIRLDYRTFDHRFIYRERLRIKLPLRWRSLEISPFFMEEVFLWNFITPIENRLGGGLDLSLFSRFEAFVYYFNRNVKEKGPWKHFQVMNFDVTLRF